YKGASGRYDRRAFIEVTKDQYDDMQEKADAIYDEPWNATKENCRDLVARTAETGNIDINDNIEDPVVFAPMTTNPYGNMLPGNMGTPISHITVPNRQYENARSEAYKVIENGQVIINEDNFSNNCTED
ncbi:MAG: hypothetical protein ACOC1O_03920, partial [bacterium]